MLNIFRRHVAGCKKQGKRSKDCPSKPPCPIHYEGIDGQERRVKSRSLIDPRTKSGVRDWSRAAELIRDLEAPAPTIKPEVRTTTKDAVDHFLKLKKGKSCDTYRKSERILCSFNTFMEARGRQFIAEVKFPDLTDFCAGWEGANRTKIRDLGIVTSFLKYCNQADFTPKNQGAGLFKTMKWADNKGPRDPFEPQELEKLWQVLPNYPDEYGRLGQSIAKQVEAFVYLMRYTGMDVSTTMTLPKGHVRGNSILTYRLKNDAEVWTIVPDWVIAKLMAAPHDGDRYFFWSGEGKAHTRASKWFSRLRKLLDSAGLQHRTPHNFRHYFAVEHLLKGTPIEDVSRLLGHANISVTVKSYAAWIKDRQVRLEGHQQRVWSSDPLHQRMIEAAQPALAAAKVIQ
jgi:site-specific recombinase XerD